MNWNKLFAWSKMNLEKCYKTREKIEAFVSNKDVIGSLKILLSFELQSCLGERRISSSFRKWIFWREDTSHRKYICFLSLSLKPLLWFKFTGSWEGSITVNGNISSQGHLSRISLSGRWRSLCIRSHSCQSWWWYNWLSA